MKKTLKRFVLVLAFVGLLTSTVFAAEGIMPRSSKYIFGSNANIIAQSNGNLLITFWVSSPVDATALGASSIDIYENNGRSERRIDTIYATDKGYENMMGSGTYHGSNITYTGTIGYQYYAKVRLTAKDSTGSDTIVETSPTVTAKR